MKCKSVEKLLLAGEDRDRTAAEKQAVEAHLADCPACREFQEARQRMRAGLTDLWRAEPPQALSERTRRACLDALRRGRSASPDHDPAARPRASRGGSRIPAPVIAASAVFTAATVVWVVLSLLGAGPLDSWKSLEALPLAAQVGLLLVAQNAFVLLLAPVILRRGRGDREGPENNGSTVSEIS